MIFCWGALTNFQKNNKTSLRLAQNLQQPREVQIIALKLISRLINKVR